MEKLPPERMRLRILRILEASRSQPVRDGLILQVLYERQLGVTLGSIRSSFAVVAGAKPDCFGASLVGLARANLRARGAGHYVTRKPTGWAGGSSGR